MKNTPKTDHLSFAQEAVVKRGFKDGLKGDQVAVYADPKFSPEQMEEIRLGLLQGMSESEIRVIADPLVSVEEMRRIRKICRLSGEIDKGMDEFSSKVRAAELRAKFPFGKKTPEQSHGR